MCVAGERFTHSHLLKFKPRQKSMNLYKEKDKQFTELFPVGVLPQPAQTVPSVSALILPTLQTQSLLLPPSTSGAQAPGRNKEHFMIYPEVRNTGCP